MSVRKVRTRRGGPKVWRVGWVNINGHRRHRRFAEERQARVFDALLRHVATGCRAVARPAGS